MNIPTHVIDSDKLDLYEIDGHTYTGQQMSDAIRVCYEMALSYAMGSPDNGGDQHIEWEWLDSTAERADLVMADRMDEVVQEARGNNDYVPDDTDTDTETEAEED
ncbi:hypothetical protein J7E62_24550 [Variovorax paradoxus]|nr:hypothetical protein [Variovorax paradoxus]